MNKKVLIFRNRWFYLLELLSDILIVTISYYYSIKIQRPNLFIDKLPNAIIIQLIYIAVMSGIIFCLFKIYKCGQTSFLTTIFNIILALPIIAVMSVLADFAINGIGIWRKTLLYALSIQIPVLFIINLIFFKLHSIIIKPIPSIVIGNTLEHASKLMLKLKDKFSKIYKIKFISSQRSDKLFLHIKRSKQVFICSSCDNSIKTKIIEYCTLNNIDCSLVPSYSDIIINSGKFDNADDLMLLNMVVKLDIESRIIKRTIDIIISIISLVILSPLILIIVILIKLQDGGNPFYSQIRVTRNNKEFTIYKFRTMIENAEKNTGAILSTKNDTRITKLGRFLRASRMDEIPQLLNVLKGEMTLVGPRPERPDLINRISKEIPEFKYRTRVKAGVTGLAQTMGRYDTEFRNKLMFDLYYVNNYSLILDLKIMFYTLHTLTIPSVTTGINNDISKINSIDIIENMGYKRMKNECILSNTNMSSRKVI